MRLTSTISRQDHSTTRDVFKPSKYQSSGRNVFKPGPSLCDEPDKFSTYSSPEISRFPFIYMLMCIYM